MSYLHKHWISYSGILKDGREFKVEWLQRFNYATFEDPEECENGLPYLFIDGEETNDWPKELTDKIEELEADATYDREYE